MDLSLIISSFKSMTSLRRRIENIIVEASKANYTPEKCTEEFAIIKEALEKYSTCCITLKDEMINCDYLGSLPKEVFFSQCRKCREEIKYMIKELEGRFYKKN